MREEDVIVGEIYYWIQNPMLRIQATYKDPSGYAEAKVIGTYPDSAHSTHKVGYSGSWNWRVFEPEKAQVQTSECDCYWSRHPLLCKCNRK